MSFSEIIDRGRGQLDEPQAPPHHRLRMQSLINQYGLVPPRQPPTHRLKACVMKFYHSVSLLGIINAVLDAMPVIRCVKEYKIRTYLVSDIIAGITVAIMHIPQGIAYGLLANLSPKNGLYVSFFPVIIYVIFGTCPHLSIGTFAIISLLTGRVVNDLLPSSSTSNGNDSSVASNMTTISDELLENQRVGIATTLAFFVGLIELVLWIFRLGFITTYMTEPFINSLNVGAAVQIFSSQIPPAFGVKNPNDIQGFFKLPRFYVRVIGSIVKSINWISTAIALSSIIILLVVKKLNERYKKKIRIVLPTEFILVILATLISYLSQMHERHGVTIVGPVTRGLPRPVPPPFTHASSLFVSAITIALVSICLNISVATMFGRKHGYKVRANQELLAYGLANIIPSFFQCYPSSGSLSRSSVLEESGGKTQLMGVVSSIFLAVVLLALAPLLQYLPNACLAGIVIVNLKGLLFQITNFRYYYRLSILECLLWVITFLTVILSDVDIGVYVGLSVSFLINTIRTQRPRFAILGRVGDTEFYKIIKVFPSAKQHPNIKILRFDGPLYACNAPFFKRKLYELIGIRIANTPLISFKKAETVQIEENPIKYVILDCSPINFMDTVGVKLLIDVFNDLKQRDIQLYLSECHYDVRSILTLMDFYGKTGCSTAYVSTHDAAMVILTEIKNQSRIETISESNITCF